jgi:TonB-dependent receptor
MKKSLSLVLILVSISFNVFSQTATLKGTIKDASNGEVIPFAGVYLESNTAVGTTSNFDGHYSLTLEPGTHKVVYSFTTYNSIIKIITLKPGETVTSNVELTAAEGILESLEVFAEKKTNTESAIMREVMESKQVVNAVSSEMIEKTQDSDASEVVKRVPGVTIVGSSFIMIRGLSERYNNVMLHDVFAPSMETDVKSFAFDIIPSGMIDRIMIYKSPAPEVTGEFAGGVVKIYTKGIPDSTSTSVSVSTTFRDGSSFKNFLQPKRGALHWTGFNDGYNDLPNRFPTNLKTVENSNPEMLVEAGQALKNNWLPEQVNSLMDKSFTVTHAHKMKWGSVDVGNISSVTYSNSRTIFNSERNDYNAYDVENQQSRFIYSFNDVQYSQNIRTGFLHNWAFRFNSNHSIEFKNMFNVFNTTEYVNRTGYDFEFNYSPNNHSFNQMYRGLYSGQLMGKHYFNDNKTKLNWTASYGYSYRDQPDYRRYRTDVDTTNGVAELFIGIPLSPNYLGRFYSKLFENSQSASIALEHKLGKDAKKWEPLLKTGIFFERKYREFSARNIGYVQSNFMFFDQDLKTQTIDNVFAPENINLTTGIRIGEATNPSDSYTASNLLSSGYLGAELPFTKKLTLNTGVRTEYNIQQLNSATFTNTPIIVYNPILSVLPSANLSYFIKEEKMLVRAAYGKSVNRPEFRELAPFGFYDFNFNLVKKGSDSLRTPTIHNFDLRWELYPNLGEMITFGVFYKKFNDPIETLFVPGGGSGGIKTFTYGNANFATSRGIEVEVRKSLDGISKSTFLSNVSVLFNASIIQSQVNLGMAQLGQSNERPLQGQSPYIVNAGLFYQNKNNDFQCNILYNVIGERIFIIGFDVYPDIYEMPRNILDVNFSKKLGKHMEMKLSFGDLLNQEFLLIQDANQNGIFERNSDQVIQRYRPGSTISFGFGYRF